MDIIKEEIMQLMEPRIRFVNKSEDESLDIFYYENEKNTTDDILLSSYLKDGDVLKSIYSMLKTQQSRDTDFEITIFLVSSINECIENNFLFIESTQAILENCIEHGFFTGEERLKVSERLKKTIHDKFKTEIMKIKNTNYDNILCTLDKNFRNDQRNTKYINMKGYLLFQQKKYVACFKLIQNINHELAFYCKIFMNTDLTNITAGDVNLRYFYVALRVAYTEAMQFDVIYNVFSLFSCDSELLKAFAEFELAKYLSYVNVYKRRIPLALFYCSEIFIKYGLNDLAGGCIEELDGFDIDDRIKYYIKEMSKKFELV